MVDKKSEKRTISGSIRTDTLELKDCDFAIMEWKKGVPRNLEANTKIDVYDVKHDGSIDQWDYGK